MQDSYIGDIGDYGKFGLLRELIAAGFRLAINWYHVIPNSSTDRKQDDGKYISYLQKPEQYRPYDPALFDCLSSLVAHARTIQALEASGILKSEYFSTQLTGASRLQWHQDALAATAEASLVFLDPDNGLETEAMNRRGTATDKHVTRQELTDYYCRGQSVLLYQHRPQRTRKEACIRRVLDFSRTLVPPEHTLLLEYPRYTNRYYFLLAQPSHHTALKAVFQTVARRWQGLCRPIEICRLTGDL